MIVEASDLIPPGMHALWHNGRAVWMGQLGMPIEDAVCDKIMVHPSDYGRIKAAAVRAGYLPPEGFKRASESAAGPSGHPGGHPAWRLLSFEELMHLTREPDDHGSS
jgi:hypothetical protein